MIHKFTFVDLTRAASAALANYYYPTEVGSS
jgi:hypothetical protein